ncbi:MAG TPA: hypothetical protein VLV90_03675 [Burkholderiales bacterium]|nr:hypothetical protein [Burkholderiales bacterium]
MTSFLRIPASMLAAAANLPPAAAQPYPSKPVDLMVPLATGLGAE